MREWAYTCDFVNSYLLVCDGKVDWHEKLMETTEITDNVLLFLRRHAEVVPQRSSATLRSCSPWYGAARSSDGRCRCVRERECVESRWYDTCRGSASSAGSRRVAEARCVEHTWGCILHRRSRFGGGQTTLRSGCDDGHSSRRPELRRRVSTDEQDSRTPQISPALPE